MKIIDAHLHAREPGSVEFDEVMPIYSALSAGVYMMNFATPLDLSSPDAAIDRVAEYHAEIMGAAKNAGNRRHRAYLMPVMAADWTPSRLWRFLGAAVRAKLPLAGFKLFTPGQSTNAASAPTTEQAAPLIDVLEEADIPLALHMEDPDEPILANKEAAAVCRILPWLLSRAGARRDMRISMEHISTAEGLTAAREYGLRYTITPHHLAVSREMLGARRPESAEEKLKMNPFLFCKPIIGSSGDRATLAWRFAKMDGDIMLGSDSAPHDQSKKVHGAGIPVENPAAGIFMGGTLAAYGVALGDMTRDYAEKYSVNAAEFYRMDLDRMDDAKEPDESGLKRVFNARDLIADLHRARPRE
ncbi:MAG: hypothetical protein LBL46_02690 [Rickettsiales bacterium]|jgi:dihydroorotase|nr:hypothetical protein [Rickettsiales bacterium]